MKTQEIGIFALQSHTIGVLVEKNICICKLIDGRIIRLVCPDERRALQVRSTIMYFPITHEHAGHEFNFEVEIITS